MKWVGALLLCLALSVCLNAQLPVNLGTAGNFAILAGSTITNTGPTVVNGNIGVSPGTAIVGFPPGIVIGTINAGNPVAAQGESDLINAYNDASGRICPGPPLPGDIGGTTIMPGVYCNASSVGITGVVTLNGNGNPNAVFIFQIGSTLTTAANNSTVNLINGATAANVFWRVGSSATLGTNTIFNGTILAQASITATTGAVLNGRALAITGASTLANNSVTIPGPPGGGGAPSVTCSFPSGQVGVAYTSALVGTGGTPPYSFSITTGSLPPGLALNTSTGAITGIPTTPGTFSDTSRVLDSAGMSSTSNCGITIVPAGGGALSLTCPPNAGQVGVAYFASVVAAGGTAPYTFSITAGSLPPGLTLNTATGVVSGTPTTAGPFNFTAKVVDATTASATSGCGPLIIAAGVPPAPTPAPPSLILVITALALSGLYLKRERLLSRFRSS